MLRVDNVVHHYINFVSIFNVVCVSSLRRRRRGGACGEGPTVEPVGRKVSHQEMSALKPEALLL